MRAYRGLSLICGRGGASFCSGRLAIASPPDGGRISARLHPARRASTAIACLTPPDEVRTSQRVESIGGQIGNDRLIG
jgi:hypothetical protein